MKKISNLFIAASLFLFLGCSKTDPVVQVSVQRIETMPNLPQPLEIIDWHQMALDFDKKAYDFDAKGEYWPLVWIDKNAKNFPQPTLGLYTAMGDVRQGLEHNKGMFHEALANMGAVLGASLVGIDKSKQHYDYVAMLKNYFNSETGWNIMMNNTAPEVALLGGGYGRDWWYDVFPNVLFYAIYDKYPNQAGFDTIARTIAEKFYKADSILNGNYSYSFFDYGKMQPMNNHICAQPDVAAGHAYVLYAAYQKFGDERYLKGAKSAMDALEKQPINPTYEVLMPFGAYLAARMNAEAGTNYNTGKMLDWTFDGTAKCREGWGALVGNWNGYDISGTFGSTVDHGGYAFLMNTFDAAWPLVPLVRYEPAYANAIGKWMLNAVNASRFFYPQYMPEDHQTIPQLAHVTKGVIAYEGFAKASTFDTLYTNKKAPVAQGDGPKWVPGQNPEVSQFSVYGSGHVGIFGSIVGKTNVDGILMLNLNATDFFSKKHAPAYLFFNPYDEEKNIEIANPLLTDARIFSLLKKKEIADDVKKTVKITIKPRQSEVLAFVAQNEAIKQEGRLLKAGDMIISDNWKD